MLETLFIIYTLSILILILCLIIFKYFNVKVRENLKNNTDPSPTNTNELNRANCANDKIYCINDNDCLQMCSHATDKEFLTQYKCNEVNVCTQSKLDNENENTNIFCNREHGFFPILTADEIFQPHWVCLNTRPYLFDDNQEYHSYICSGGDISKLKPSDIYGSCICGEGKVKVRDEFRNNIPICINKAQLSLFPNFTLEK